MDDEQPIIYGLEFQVNPQQKKTKCNRPILFVVYFLFYKVNLLNSTKIKNDFLI